MENFEKFDLNKKTETIATSNTTPIDWEKEAEKRYTHEIFPYSKTRNFISGCKFGYHSRDKEVEELKIKLKDSETRNELLVNLNNARRDKMNGLKKEIENLKAEIVSLQNAPKRS